MRGPLALGVLALAGVLMAGPAHAQEATAPLSTEALPPPAQNWSFNGPFGTFNRASAQRGYQVWQQVCSNCHSMKELYYRNLGALGFTDAEGQGARRGADRAGRAQRQRRADDAARQAVRPVSGRPTRTTWRPAPPMGGRCRRTIR